MVVVPVAAIVTAGFEDGFASFRTAFAIPYAWTAIRLTLITSAAATVINAVMGTLLAWVLVRYRFPGRRILSSVVDLPMAIPTLVTGLMILTLYGPNAPIGRFLDRFGIQVAFTWIGILLALCVVTLPLVVRQVQPVLLELDPAEEEAAATLGAGAWLSFRKVVLPALRPAIVGGGLLTFARCIGEFGSVVLVSGNIAGRDAHRARLRVPAREPVPSGGGRGGRDTDVHHLVRTRAGDHSAADPEGGSVSAPPEPVAPATGAAGSRSRFARGALAAAAIVYVALLLLLPLIGIVTKAFEPGVSIIGDTLSSPDVQHAFLLTGIITVITIVVTTFFGLVVAWVLVRQRFLGRSLMNAVVDLPFALSPVTVGLAAVLLFGTGGWFADFFSAQGIQILFALPSMVLVTIFICIPFTIRELVPVLEEFGLDEEDASRTLGASIWQTFRRVTLPNIRWALLYGIALTTARSIGEIGAVLIVSGTISGSTETATIYIFTALEERLEAQAHVVALVLATVSILLLVGIEWLHRRNERARSHA